MSKEHIEYAKSCSCDLCGTYFGNRHLLAEHNTKEHSSDEQTEDIIEVESETSKHDCNYFPAKFKYLDELKWHIEQNHDKTIKKSKLKQLQSPARTVLHPFALSGVLAQRGSGAANQSGVPFIVLN